MTGVRLHDFDRFGARFLDVPRLATFDNDRGSSRDEARE